MKNSIKSLIAAVLLVNLLLAGASSAFAITLSEREVRLMNGISIFLDRKPEGPALRPIETAMKSSNPALRGLAALILFRHYGDAFRSQLLRNFTLNQSVERFAADKKTLVKIENVDRLLAGYQPLLEKFKDERVRQLFLFYHFRHKQVYMLGASEERLSLAAFYRVGLFEQILGASHDVIALASAADR